MDVQNEMLMAKRTKEMLNPDQLPDQDRSHIKKRTQQFVCRAPLSPGMSACPSLCFGASRGVQI